MTARGPTRTRITPWTEHSRRLRSDLLQVFSGQTYLAVAPVYEVGESRSVGSLRECHTRLEIGPELRWADRPTLAPMMRIAGEAMGVLIRECEQAAKPAVAKSARRTR